MAVNPNKPGTMAYSIWEKNQAKKQAAVVSPATPQGLGTMLLNQQASSVPPVIKNATMPKTMPKVLPAGSMPGSTQISKTTGQVVPRRATPTVATAQNPVVSKDLTTKPNISTLDKQGLQDYIDTYNVKSKFGTVKEADALEAVKAQRMLNAMIMEEQKNAATTNPMSEYADKLEQDRATLEAQLTSKNQTARQAKQAELDARYATLRTRQEEAGVKQSLAAQRSTSTSGFGRSTFNADQQVGIEKETQNAITQLEQAKIAEMERFDAEQQGASAEVLASFEQRIAEARQSAMEAQMKSLSEADRINKETGASMEESIKNLIATGESGGMDIKAGDEQAITMLAQIAKNKDGSWNNAMLSQLPDGIREIVMAASSTGYGTKQGEAAKTISIGSGKNERVMQWNPETGRYDIPVGGGGGGSGAPSGFGSGGLAINQSGLEGVQPKDRELVLKVIQYRDLLNGSTALGNMTDPNMKARLSNLKAEITANYKQANKLGTLDNGVQRLIDGLLGAGGIAKYNNKAQVGAIDQMLTNLGYAETKTAPGQANATTTTNTTTTPQKSSTTGKNKALSLMK